MTTAVDYGLTRYAGLGGARCEDFLDRVRAPLFNVIGGVNNGWRVAMTTLGHERGGRATVQHLGFEREFWELADTACKYGPLTDPLVRQQLRRDRDELLDLEHHLRLRRPPGGGQVLGGAHRVAGR